MMTSEIETILRREQRLQRLLMALFGLGVCLISLSSYTTRSFLDSQLPTPGPSAFAAVTPLPVPGAVDSGEAARTASVATGRTQTTRTGAANPASFVNDLPVGVTDNLTGGQATDSGILGGSATNSGQNLAGQGQPGPAPGNGGTNGPTQLASQSVSGGNRGFASTLPGGTAGGNGGGVIGSAASPVIVPVPEPEFWLTVILGFAVIGAQIRSHRAKALVQREAIAA